MRAFLCCVELRPIVSGDIKCDFPAQPPKMIHNGFFAEGADRMLCSFSDTRPPILGMEDKRREYGSRPLLAAGVAGPAAPSDLQKAFLAVKVGLEALEI